MIGGSRPLGAIIGDVNIPVGGRRDPLSIADAPFVMEKRAQGASWDAIGAMLDRPTPDVRATFDPAYVPLYKADLARSAPARREPPVRRLEAQVAGGGKVRTSWPETMEADVLAALAERAGSSGDVAHRIGLPMPKVSAVLAGLCKRRLVDRRPRPDGLNGFFYSLADDVQAARAAAGEEAGQ